MVTEAYIDIHTHNGVAGKNAFYNFLPKGIPVLLPENYFSAGLHPWYIENDYPEKIEIIRNLAENRNCVAIGEAGFDKLRGASFELQEKVFKIHIDIAEKTRKPVIIHCVRAAEELIKIHRKMQPTVPWILHGYNSGPQKAKRLMDEGMILSFGKELSRPGSNAQKTLEIISDHIFFLETDDGDLTIQEIYRHASAILKTDIQELIVQLQKNFKQIFGFDYG
jgi:TatD DNase family protein